MKRLYIIALFVFAGGFASAQENGNRDAQNRIVRGPYETNRFFDNIFVGVAGGVNLYFGENDSEGKFGKRLAPAMDIHVGKWFTPSIGARVGYAGLQVVLDEGYIKSFQVIDGDNTQGTIRITLKYNAGKEKVITGLRRVSKPGLRVYVGADELPRVLRGLGIAIISTSKGVMTDKAARAAHVGGEVLAFVW